MPFREDIDTDLDLSHRDGFVACIQTSRNTLVYSAMLIKQLSLSMTQIAWHKWRRKQISKRIREEKEIYLYVLWP